MKEEDKRGDICEKSIVRSNLQKGVVLRNAKTKRGKRTKDIRLDKRWLTLEMTPKEYGRLIGHSEGYVRKYIMKDTDADILRVRIPTDAIMEDIYDVRGISKA